MIEHVLSSVRNETLDEALALTPIEYVLEDDGINDPEQKNLIEEANRIVGGIKQRIIDAKSKPDKEQLGKYRAGHYSSDMIAAMVKEAFKRGMDKVLSRVPSKKEFYDKLDTTTDYIGLDNTPINTDSFYDWILAKLKEPT